MSPQPVPPALTATPDLMALLQGLRRRWISAVLIGGTLAAVAAVGAWYALTPKNVAVAKLLVATEDPTILGLARNDSRGDFQTFMQTAAGQIMSRPVILSALKRDEVKKLKLESREPDPVIYVEDELKVEIKQNSELLTILMSSTDPVVAATIANAVKEAYMDDIVFAQANARVKKVTELEKAYGEASDALSSKKKNLTKIAQSLGSTDPLMWVQQRMETLSALRDAKQQQMTFGLKLVEARSELEAFNARVKAYNEQSQSMDKNAPAGSTPNVEAALDNDPEAKKLRDRISSLEVQHEGFVEKGGANYITAIRMRDRIETLKKKLDERREVVAERVKNNVTPAGPTVGPEREDPAIVRTKLQKTVEEYNQLNDQAKAEVEKLTAQANRPQTLGPEYESLAEEVKQQEGVVNELNSKLAREQVELRAAPRITRFHDAELMKKDNKKQIMASIAAPIAVLGAVCMSLAWFDFRQRRVRTASEVSRGLGIRVVGAVPNTPGLERKLVNAMGENDLEGTPVLESIDAIRTQLLHEADSRATRLVMVTSAVAGEGKTTLACHLASSLARAGRKTLLVDGDLRRPTIHELFEVPMQPGFSEALLGEVEVTESWQETTVENLTVMAAGQWDREVLLALSRGGMEGMFEKLTEEFDFVVIDSHPVMAATDALQLGKLADAVILSVLRDVSQMPRVYGAAQKLQSLGIRVLGAVVNGTDPEELFTNPAGGHAHAVA